MNVTIFCPGPTYTEFLEQAFTDKPGVKYNQSALSTDRRMTAERCAFLMATALSNQLEINFVGPFPVPALMYISCYYPNLRKLYVLCLNKYCFFLLFFTNLFLVRFYQQSFDGVGKGRPAKNPRHKPQTINQSRTHTHTTFFILIISYDAFITQTLINFFSPIFHNYIVDVFLSFSSAIWYTLCLRGNNLSFRNKIVQISETFRITFFRRVFYWFFCSGYLLVFFHFV